MPQHPCSAKRNRRSSLQAQRSNPSCKISGSRNTGLLRHFTPRNDGGAESGNAVLMILLGVALFGALSYTFMRGSQSGQGNLTSNQAKLAAQEILDYSQTIDRAVNKLLQKGCSEIELNFAGFSPNISSNPNAPPDGHCDIFTSSGANVAYKLFPESYFNPRTASTHLRIREPVLPGIGTTKSDLTLAIPFFSTEICMKINELVGVQNLPTSPPLIDGQPGSNWVGIFNNVSTLNDLSGSITGKKAFCSYGTMNATTANRYYYTFIER